VQHVQPLDIFLEDGFFGDACSGLIGHHLRGRDPRGLRAGAGGSLFPSCSFR
jgi:hypothetical protein